MKLINYRTQTLATLFALVVFAPGASFAQVKHLVVVGVDGLSPDGILHADAPNLKRLREQGAWTFHACGVMPTSNRPNWASLIMGAGLEERYQREHR